MLEAVYHFLSLLVLPYKTAFSTQLLFQIALAATPLSKLSENQSAITF